MVVALVGAVCVRLPGRLLVSPLRTAAVQDGDAGQRRSLVRPRHAPEAAARRSGRRLQRKGVGGRRRRPSGRAAAATAARSRCWSPTARYADVPVTVDAVGTVQAANTVTVRSQVDGKLIEIDFKEGQDVKKGDVLARIDPATYQAQYDQAVAKKAQDEAMLANAQVDLDRYAKLAETQYGSHQQADTQKALVAQTEAHVQQDQAAIDNAKAMLDYATIRSPIDGRTGIRLVDQGNIVHASDTTGIVSIAQVQPIAVVFSLPQQHLPAGQCRAWRKGAVAGRGARGRQHAPCSTRAACRWSTTRSTRRPAP